MESNRTQERKPGWLEHRTIKRAVKKNAQQLAFMEIVEVSSTELPSAMPLSRETWALDREKYRRYGSLGDRITPRTALRAARAENVTAVYYCSVKSLEHQAHRFTFESDGSLSYYKVPFNVDCQSFGSDIVKLDTLDDVLGHKGAKQELDWLLGQLNMDMTATRLGGIALKT